MRHVDNDIQLKPGWQSHTGGNIGGDAAKVYTMNQQFPPVAIFSIAGCEKLGGYADVDWYLQRPIQPNNGLVTMSYSIMLDEDSFNNAQAIETDLIITEKGLNYNGSVQIDYSVGGQLQIANRNGDWTSTGYSPGKYQPNVWHEVKINYYCDPVQKVLSVICIIIDNVFYMIPPTLHHVPAVFLNWSDGAMIQIQQDLNQKALQYQMQIKNLDLTWY